MTRSSTEIDNGCQVGGVQWTIDQEKEPDEEYLESWTIVGLPCFWRAWNADGFQQLLPTEVGLERANRLHCFHRVYWNHSERQREAAAAKRSRARRMLPEVWRLPLRSVSGEGRELPTVFCMSGQQNQKLFVAHFCLS